MSDSSDSHRRRLAAQGTLCHEREKEESFVDWKYLLSKEKELPLLTLVTSLSSVHPLAAGTHTRPITGWVAKAWVSPITRTVPTMPRLSGWNLLKRTPFQVPCWLFSYKKGLCCSPLYNNIILNILSKIYVSLQCWKLLENCDPIIWPPASPPAIVLALFCCFNEYRFSLFKENGIKNLLWFRGSVNTGQLTFLV